MQLTGPAPVAFGPSSAQVVIANVSFDLIGHTFAVTYGPPNGGPGMMKTVRGNIPAALQTSLENHAQAVVEADAGWAAGSATIAQP